MRACTGRFARRPLPYTLIALYAVRSTAAECYSSTRLAGWLRHVALANSIFGLQTHVWIYEVDGPAAPQQAPTGTIDGKLVHVAARSTALWISSLLIERAVLHAARRFIVAVVSLNSGKYVSNENS